jgi:hypothetical protein
MGGESGNTFVPCLLLAKSPGHTCSHLCCTKPCLINRTEDEQKGRAAKCGVEGERSTLTRPTALLLTFSANACDVCFGHLVVSDNVATIVQHCETKSGCVSRHQQRSAVCILTRDCQCTRKLTCVETQRGGFNSMHLAVLTAARQQWARRWTAQGPLCAIILRSRSTGTSPSRSVSQVFPPSSGLGRPWTRMRSMPPCCGGLSLTRRAAGSQGAQR